MEFEIAWLSVSRSLPKSDLYRLMQVGKELNELVSRDEVWASHLHTDFPQLRNGNGDSLLSIYREAYLKTFFVRWTWKPYQFTLMKNSTTPPPQAATGFRFLLPLECTFGRGTFASQHPPIVPKEGYTDVCINKFDIRGLDCSVAVVKEIMKVFLTCFWDRQHRYFQDYLSDTANHPKVPFKVVKDAEGDFLYVFYFFNPTRHLVLENIVLKSSFKLNKKKIDSQSPVPCSDSIAVFHDILRGITKEDQKSSKPNSPNPRSRYVKYVALGDEDHEWQDVDIDFPPEQEDQEEEEEEEKEKEEKKKEEVKEEEVEDNVFSVIWWMRELLRAREEGGDINSHKRIFRLQMKSFFKMFITALPIYLTGLKPQGKLEDRFAKHAWKEHLPFLSNFKWVQVIIKPLTNPSTGAHVWDIPPPLQLWVGRKGAWYTGLQDWAKEMEQKVKAMSGDEDAELPW